MTNEHRQLHSALLSWKSSVKNDSPTAQHVELCSEGIGYARVTCTDGHRILTLRSLHPLLSEVLDPATAPIAYVLTELRTLGKLPCASGPPLNWRTALARTLCDTEPPSYCVNARYLGLVIELASALESERAIVTAPTKLAEPFKIELVPSPRSHWEAIYFVMQRRI